MPDERVISYVDGHNLYYGLREKGWRVMSAGGGSDGRWGPGAVAAVWGDSGGDEAGAELVAGVAAPAMEGIAQEVGK